MQNTVFNSLVETEIAKVSGIILEIDETAQAITQATTFFQVGNYEQAAQSFLEIASSFRGTNSHTDIETFQIASYRYAIAKAFQFSEGERELDFYKAAEYYFSALQMTHSCPPWVYKELISLPDCALAWLICLIKSSQMGFGFNYSDGRHELIRNALDSPSPHIHQLIASGLARLHYVNPRVAIDFEKQIFDSLGSSSINNLKKNLLFLIKKDKKKVDERTPRDQLFEMINNGISDAIGKAQKGIQSFVGIHYLEILVNARHSILEGLNLLLPYTLNTNSENRLCRETIRLIRDDLVAYKNAKEAFSIQELTSINNRIRNFEEDLEENFSWFSSCYLNPIVTHLITLLENDRDNLGQKYFPTLTIEAIKTHWPLSSSGNHIDIELEIKNLGNAPADRVRVVVSVEKDFIDDVELMNAKTLELGSIQPGTNAHQNISLFIKQPSTFVYLECLCCWEDLGGTRDSLINVKLLSQSKINWEEIKSMRPYSTKSKDQRDQLKGRDKILDSLFAGILSAKSYFITGQRRVGKTSIARVLEHELRDSRKAIVVYSPWGKIITGSGAKIPIQFFEYYCEKIRKEAQSLNPGLTGLDSPSLDDLTRNYSRAFEDFLAKFKAKFPNHKIIIMVDDLDEMPVAFYTSEDGNAFFSSIRAFLDEDFLSFVFIANEKLNSILQAQQGKLNLVVTQQVDYLHRSSLDRLVKEPVQNMLEFQEDSLDYVYNLSAGNPYYATILCERVFDDMLASKDYLVAKENIDHALEELISTESSEGFVHFWSDGISTDDPNERIRIKDENARILIALSQQKSDTLGFVSTNGISELDVTKYIEPTVIDARINALVNRRVLDAHSESSSKLRIHVPLFAEWLKRSGTAKILDVQRGGTYVNTTPIKSIPDSEILPICNDLHYRGREIRPEQVREFLEQFGRVEDQKLILKLLKRLRGQGYWSERRMRDAVRVIDDAIKTKYKQHLYIVRRGQSAPQVDNLFITCVPGAGKSGQLVLRQIRSEWSGLYNPNIDEMSDVTRSVNGFLRNRDNKGKKAIVCIVDDFVGTGNSAIDGLRIEMDQFYSKLGGLVENCFIFYGVLSGFEGGINAIRIELTDSNAEFTAQSFHVLTEKDKAFSQSAKIFSDDSEILAAKDLCRMAGQVLYPEGPLGFGDCQALVVFNNSIPNNSLPIFWAQGKHWRGKGMWKPLFPRQAYSESS